MQKQHTNSAIYKNVKKATSKRELAQALHIKASSERAYADMNCKKLHKI